MIIVHNNRAKEYLCRDYVVAGNTPYSAIALPYECVGSGFKS